MWYLLLVCSFIIQNSIQSEIHGVNEPTVLYFGYGSNLLGERLHRTVNATRYGIGLLPNFRLDFEHFSKRWNGYAATIVPHFNQHVWVAIWQIRETDLEKIDRQEGVSEHIYRRIIVSAHRPDGSWVNGYTYILFHNPDLYIPLNMLPSNRQPSKAYLDVIIQGAKESNLPLTYQSMLQNIAHNGYNGAVHYSIQ